jgi:predicted dehydrogenase
MWAMTIKKNLTRRQLLKAAGAAAAFTIVPRHVLGGPGYTPPSEKLNIAAIGCGGRGEINLEQLQSENIVAMCDVYDAFAGGPFQRWPNSTKYRDFRVMLEKEQNHIDAVLVATPNHTHAVATMAAIQVGKHVYCEKPLTHTIYETRRVMEAARNAGVATQMGNHGHAEEGIRLICEWIWDGAIGPVREAHAWASHPYPPCVNYPAGCARPSDEPPLPDSFDWDLWIGPAKYRPYHPNYAPFTWRGWCDFGNDGIGDMANHTIDPAIMALKLSPYNLKSVEASSTPCNGESFPHASIIRYQFNARGDQPPFTLNWYNGGLMPPMINDLEEGRVLGNMACGMLMIGDKGMLVSGSHAQSPRLIPESLMQSYQRPAKTLPRSIGHHQEWINACKGGDPAGSNFDYGGPATELVLLGNLAQRVCNRRDQKYGFNSRIEWDAANMKAINRPEADEFITTEYRAGWSL